MRLRKLLLLRAVVVALAARLARHSRPRTVWARAPTAEEIRAWDIAISPDGKELPPGRGSAKEGAPLYAQKCAACHGATDPEAGRLN